MSRSRIAPLKVRRGRKIGRVNYRPRRLIGRMNSRRRRLFIRLGSLPTVIKVAAGGEFHDGSKN